MYFFESLFLRRVANVNQVQIYIFFFFLVVDIIEVLSMHFVSPFHLEDHCRNKNYSRILIVLHVILNDIGCCFFPPCTDYLNPFHAYDEGNLSWLVLTNSSLFYQDAFCALQGNCFH